MRKLQKAWMPWTAADQFPSEAEFQTHLKQRLHVFDVLRKVMLVLASVCLIAGYVVDRRPIMLVTVFPWP